MTPQSDVALAPLCTMGVGGPARWFIDARSESDIASALRWARAHEVDVCILGGGSNVVIADEGVQGLVLHVNLHGVEETCDGDIVTYAAAAGEPWDALVAKTVASNCAGLECLSGIPGYVGGTPVQNVGAYGQDVSGTITRVRVVDRQTRAALAFTNGECGFGYRTSRFKREDVGRFVVTGVEFTLALNGRATVEYADVVSQLAKAGKGAATLSDVRNAVLTIRRGKGMVIEPGNQAKRSCGSFFVNPVVSRGDLKRMQQLAGPQVPHYELDDNTVKVPAAWLIERAGFPKGTVRGAVGISPFQAQAIINRGAAQAADIVAFASDVKRAVWNMFGLSIVPEPVFIGFSHSSTLQFLQTHLRSH